MPGGPECCCNELGPLSLRSGDICSACERWERQKHMSDKKYPTDPAGQKDAGSERHTRFRPCVKSTWCVREDGHVGGCEERNRPTAKK